MVTTTGLVDCFGATAISSYVQVKNSASGVSETFVLYYLDSNNPNEKPGVEHAMWAATISAARANRQTVSIVHAETSSKIESVTIGEFVWNLQPD